MDNGNSTCNPLHGTLRGEHSCKLHASHQIRVNSPAHYKKRTRSPQLEEPVGQRQGHGSVLKPCINPINARRAR